MKKIILAILMVSTLALTACGGGTGYGNYGGYYDDNDRSYSQNYGLYQQDCLTTSGQLRSNASYACRNNTNTSTNKYTPAKPTVKARTNKVSPDKSTKTYKPSQQKTSPFKSNSGYKPGRSTTFKSR